MRLVITENNRWLQSAVHLLLILFMYLFTNHLPYAQPQYLPTLPLEDAIPFIPWTIWIYFSYYFSFIAVFVWEKDYTALNRFARAFLVANMLGNVFFMVCPTIYARPTTELPSEGINALAYMILCFLDTPANCLPSLHVANAALATLAWHKRYPRRFVAFAAWTFAIALSTLTIKQHYLYDVVGGLLLALGCYAWFFLDLPKRLSLAVTPTFSLQNRRRGPY